MNVKGENAYWLMLRGDGGKLKKKKQKMQKILDVR